MINKKKIEIKIMKKIIIYLILIVNIILYLTNTAISKVVGDKIFIGTTLSITGDSSSETLFYKNQFDRAVENINSSGECMWVENHICLKLSIMTMHLI